MTTKTTLYLTWILSLVATLGSLFYSEVLHLPPCVLCWYQRIIIYPQVVILLIAILNNDKKVYRYLLPLNFIGFAISLYHNLLYYKVIPDTISPCSTGVSCTTRYLSFFGFVTIPLQSLIAFCVIITLLLYLKKHETRS